MRSSLRNSSGSWVWNSLVQRKIGHEKGLEKKVFDFSRKTLSVWLHWVSKRVRISCSLLGRVSLWRFIYFFQNL